MTDDRFHPGTFVAGLVFAAMGLAFTLEALDVWTFQLDHFRLLGPLSLVAIGLAVLAASSWTRQEDRSDETFEEVTYDSTERR